MLQVVALSGHEVATFSPEDLPGSVKELKHRLFSLIGHSRFQQQLVFQNGLELHDNDAVQEIDLPTELTLVLRPFQQITSNKELRSGVKRNDLCRIEEILKRPVDPDAGTETLQLTPLTLASQLGFVDVVQLLLEAGAGKSSHPRYREALLFACEESQHEVVQVLIDARANISDSQPLQAACRCGYEKVAALLIEAGAALGGTMGEAEPLTRASGASLNSLEYVVRFLSDADLGEDKFIGITPLHCAADAGHLHIVKLLLDAGAAKDQSDIDGRTPLHLAAALGHVDVVRLLIKARAAIDKEDLAGRTPLHFACANEQIRALSILLEAGAASDKEDVFGKTPVQSFPNKTTKKRQRRSLIDRVRSIR